MCSCKIKYHVEFLNENRPHLEWLDIDGSRFFALEDGIATLPGEKIRNITETTLLLMTAHQGNVAVFDPVRRVVGAIAPSVEYRFDASKMAGPSQPRGKDQLSPSGDNLAAFLDSLLSGPDRPSFEALERGLHQAIPTLERIHTPAATQPQLAGAKCLRYVLAGGNGEPVSIPASLASTGALLITAYLALAYSKTPDILLFEEPENGLHPTRLALVVDVLRKMSTGELGGRPRQIIITTHNPLLLSYARPEEVRVFIADQNLGTRVRSMADVPDLDRLLKEFTVGELWYLLGEEKMFEGQPA